MTKQILARRAALTFIAAMMATSVSAFDIVCCGDGPDPEPEPEQSAEATHESRDRDNIIPGMSGPNPMQAVSLRDCRGAGGDFVRGVHCYDRDGNFIPL